MEIVEVDVTVVAEAMAEIVFHVVDMVAIEAAEATVATEMEVRVVDTLVVAIEDVAMATVVHAVAIAVIVAHADVQKVAADVEISNQIIL